MSLKKLGKALVLTAFAAGVGGVVEATTLPGSGGGHVDPYGGSFVIPDLELLPSPTDRNSQKIPAQKAGEGEGAGESQQEIFEWYRDSWKQVASAIPTTDVKGDDYGAESLTTVLEEIRDRSEGASTGTSGTEYFTKSMLVRSSAMRAILFNGLSWLNNNIDHIFSIHLMKRSAKCASSIYQMLHEYRMPAGTANKPGWFKEAVAGDNTITADALINVMDFKTEACGMNAPKYTPEEFIEVGLALKAKLATASAANVSTTGDIKPYLPTWLDAVTRVLENPSHPLVSSTYLIQVLRNLTTAGENDIDTPWIVEETGGRYLIAEKIARIAELIATNPGYMAKLSEPTTLGTNEAQEKLEAICGMLRCCTTGSSDIANGGDHIFGPANGSTRIHLMLIWLALGGDPELKYGHSGAGNTGTKDYKDTAFTWSGPGSATYFPRDVWSQLLQDKYMIDGMFVNVPGGISVKGAPTSTVPENVIF